MKNVIFDLEFTGLNNDFIKDNEIVQCKMHCIETEKKSIKNFKSNKPLTAHAVRMLGRNITGESLFSTFEFNSMIEEVVGENKEDITFWGFGISQDLKMLSGYGINLVNTKDIQEMLRCSEYQYEMATEGSSLEDTYLIIFNHIINPDHSSIEELDYILNLYNEVQEIEIDDYMTNMPWGIFAGMLISEYVQEERRAADGYRLNNDDKLASSLDHFIYNEDWEDGYWED